MNDIPEFVTMNLHQKPMPLARIDDPLVREVFAYCARLRVKAAKYREQADRYDALADRSEPVTVLLPAPVSEQPKEQQ